MSKLSLLRQMIPTAQVSDLTTGSITLPSARGMFVAPLESGYSAISSVTLSDSTTTEVTFSGFPTNANYLQIRMYAKDANSSTDLDGYGKIIFNGDTGSNYAMMSIRSEGSANYVGNSTSATGGYLYTAQGDSSYPSVYAVTTIDIYEPNNTSKTKTFMAWSGYNGISSGSSPVRHAFFAQLWNNTSAISSITLKPTTTYWKSGSVFSLYGIK